MKTNMHFFSKLLLILLAACPPLANAAPAAGSAYDTDKTNSYVQDQTSKAMQQLNDILCHVSAMDPAEMVGLGAYIALVDGSICSPDDSGGSGASTGSSYKPAIVNSTRADNASPMIAKVWLEDSGGGGGSQSIFAYLSATQAPNPPTDPYGRFRLDFCGKSGGAVCTNKGFINSTSGGLAFYSYDEGNWGGGGLSTQTMQLQLNASGSTGSGALKQVSTGPSGNPNADFYFAYNATHFMRSDSTGSGNLCFSRNSNDAAESVWSYGLYDSTTGVRIERNSGFPIEYTDMSGNTMNGYVGYWGLSTQSTVDTTKPVNKVTYGSGTPTKTPYTLLQAGGKLIKFSKVTKTLDALDKVKFQFWPQAPVTVTGGNLTSGTGCSSYEVYWNKATANFRITGQQDATNNCNIKSFASEWTMTAANMQTAAQWGLNGWSQMLGGDFGINYTDMASIATNLGNTPVVMHLQNVVYPAEFGTAPLSSGLVCIENCPTAADIGLSNALNATAATMPYISTSLCCNFGSGRAPYSYTLNSATGNLIDSATTPAAVVSTAATNSGTTGNYGNNNNGIQSGRLAIQADLEAKVALRGGTSGFYLPQDFDQITTYYQWQTGGNSWNQLAVLYNGSTPVAFDPPLNVDFVVPLTGAQYGTFLGATFTLQYGGFGNLWGIPSTCIDVSTNAACLPNGATQNNLQRWTPQFSIPTGSTVSVSSGQSVTAGTSYTVKALQKEVRLGAAPLADCSGLSLPAAVDITLPTTDTWLDPSSAASSNYVGAKPTVTDAPRVIHGVKMY